MQIDKTHYSFIEYMILDSNEIDVFVLNQPYNNSSIKRVLNERYSKFDKYFNFNYLIEVDNNKINSKFKPGLITNFKKGDIFKYLKVDGQFVINNMLFVNNFELDESLQYKEGFHGDTTSWIMGYFYESYASILFDKTELFFGRMPRNWGIPNSYSSIFSNNHFPFDHYGFNTSSNRFKYSFYFTRLNDVLAEDIKGQYIPQGEKELSKRYWSAQRLDVKVSDNFHLSLSEAVIYGGPNQNFVASYLNPVNFFYASQRNQIGSKIEMSGLWQVNFYYKPKRNIAIYLDLLVDDIIINNSPSGDDREIHPDRLGVIGKISFANLFKKENLFSIQYVRVWNETYVSFRTWENYTYFNKGIGFSFNSFESVKAYFNSFNKLPLLIETSLEVWRHGNRDMFSSLVDSLNSFPVAPVDQGLSLEVSTSYLFTNNLKYMIEFNYDFVYKPKDWNPAPKSELSQNFNLKLVCYFQKNI
jgi:hypothetical protein